MFSVEAMVSEEELGGGRRIDHVGWLRVVRSSGR